MVQLVLDQGFWSRVRQVAKGTIWVSFGLFIVKQAISSFISDQGWRNVLGV
jgi:hypothetical protein